MKLFLRMLLTTFVFGALATAANAEPITAQQAYDLLNGNTYFGENEDGQQWWFFQDTSGSFRAKFEPGFNTDVDHFTGGWFVKGEQICWDWDNWKLLCHDSFDLTDDFLVIGGSENTSVGQIVPGNPYKM